MMLDSEDEDSNSELEKKRKPGVSGNRSVPKACFFRENGTRSKGARVAKELEWAAEDIFVQKVHKEHRFQLPENARSTFLMVFSPDGKIVASTHGNHSIYVTDVRTCKTIRTLNGHPRTPWCIAFHPSSNQILASGCLGGEVRVWDLHGGSEIWTSDCHTVIASLAFHPVERVLVIATYNELYFWDWNERVPFAKCRTGHDKEKIRYVAFDHLGQKLITGIANTSPLQSQWDRIGTPSQNDPEECLRRMMNERNRERPRENFSFNSFEDSLSFPSFSERSAGWSINARILQSRQAMVEARQSMVEATQSMRNQARSHARSQNEPSAGSSAHATNILQRLAPLALQPLAEPFLQPGMSRMWRNSANLVSRDLDFLSGFITPRNSLYRGTSKRRLQDTLQRTHERFSRILAAIGNEGHAPAEREPTSSTFSHWGPSSSSNTFNGSFRIGESDETPRVLFSPAERNSAPRTNFSGSQSRYVPLSRGSCPARRPLNSSAAQLRSRIRSSESARRRYFEERIKSLRRLSDSNRSSNSTSDSSQEPRAFQRYIHSPKPSCSRTNDNNTEGQDHTKPDSSSNGQQLSYFEKLKTKFAQLSRQIKEQCSSSTSEPPSESWGPSNRSVLRSLAPPRECTPNRSRSQRGDLSDRAYSNTSQSLENVSETGDRNTQSSASMNLTNRLNSLVSNLSRVSNTLSRSVSCEFGAGVSAGSESTRSRNKPGHSETNGATKSERESSGDNRATPDRLNSEGSSGASSLSSDNLGETAPSMSQSLNQNISSFLGSLRRSSPITSSSTSSNESWQGPVSEVGNTNDGTSQSAEPAVASPSQERRRLGLKRKIDSPPTAVSSSVLLPPDSSSASSPRPDLVTTLTASRAELASNDLFLSSSSSSTFSSDSSSSSDSDNHDLRPDAVINLLRLVRERGELLRSLRNAPPGDSGTSVSSRLITSLSDSRRTVEILFGGPSRNSNSSSRAENQSVQDDAAEMGYMGHAGNSGSPTCVERQPVLNTAEEIDTTIILLQNATNFLSTLNQETRQSHINLMQRLFLRLFYLFDFWIAQSGEGPEEGESSRTTRLSLNTLEQRERLLLNELTHQIYLTYRPETNAEGSYLTETPADMSAGNSSERRPRMSFGLHFSRMRRRLGTLPNERRQQRLLRDRLEEEWSQRERATRELPDTDEARRYREDLLSFWRRRHLVRRTQQLGRQNSSIIRSLIEVVDRANEPSSVSASELLRNDEQSSSNRNNTGNQSPRSPQHSLSSLLSDPMLQQFNNSRPSSLSPQQRDHRNFSSHNSSSNNLQRPILCVPLVRVNDQPINLPAESNEPSQRNRTRSPPLFITHSRLWADDDRSPEREDSVRFLGRSFLSSSLDDPGLLPDSPRSYFTRRTIPNELRVSLHHRIQAWDFSKWTPCSALDIKNPHKNLVVADCKIYNDASVDISSDSSLLVTLLPSSRSGFTCMLGIYSLEWETLGQRLYVVSFEQNAVSVSLSPTCRYLVVGLSARRRISLGSENDTVAQILRLDGAVPSRFTSFPQKGKLTEVRGLELYRELNSMSLNCIRWAPTPGQGIVCGTNTGQLTFLR